MRIQAQMWRAYAACRPDMTNSTQVADVAEKVSPWIHFIHFGRDIDMFYFI